MIDYPQTAKDHAENAAAHADSAVRVMNDAELPQFRDRAFEELGFAITSLAQAIQVIAEKQKL